MIIKDNGHLHHKELLSRRIEERIGKSDPGFTVTLGVDETLGGPESYQIGFTEKNWLITGSDEAGLYYGIGKFLHSARWHDDRFEPKATGRVVSPDCPFRCIYFAVHFHNWYHEAPLEELERYLEDMLLYGYNALECIVPIVQITGFDDHVFLEAIQKDREIFRLAKNLGMKVLFSSVPNQAMVTAPHEWDADISFDFLNVRRGHLGRLVCPHKPGALEYLKNIWRTSLEQFKDIGIDGMIAWPYDEGGCGCEKCRPWGANGFEWLCSMLSEELRKLYPDAIFIYSTWTFDNVYDQHEYSTLYKKLSDGRMEYVDYLMTDAHEDYPRYVLEHPVVKPIVSFPEISMWKLSPWGGFGATPLVKRFEAIWDSEKAVISGGMPYSEGLYEDLSKIQFIGYYWDKNARYRDTLREYASYEFGFEAAEDAVRLMELIEKNHVDCAELKDPDLAAAEEAASIAERIDRTISLKRKQSWRWRILYIRAILDVKRYRQYVARNMHGEADNLILRHDEAETQLLKDDPEAQALYRELRRIYHCLNRDNGFNKWTLPVVQGEM